MTIKIHVPDEAIRGLLCSAFEGGSNYWYADLAPATDNTIPPEAFADGGAQQIPGTYWHWSQLMPLVDGCAVTFADAEDDGKVYRLDRKSIDNGLAVMAAKYPRHFADVLTNNDDATTADVFLQCCAFGELRYG